MKNLSLLVVLLGCALASVSAVWVTQTVYSKIGCNPVDITSVFSWPMGECITSGSKFKKYTCSGDPKKAITTTYDDALCTVNPTTPAQNLIPAADRCLSLVGTGSYVFFSCDVAGATPPSLPSVDHTVFRQTLYKTTGGTCLDADIVQKVQYVNSRCYLGETRVCDSGNLTVTKYGGRLDCSGAATAVTRTSIAGCSSNSFSECGIASTPTVCPAPCTNPVAPVETDFAACSLATTKDQCLGVATAGASGKLTLPPGGQFKKACTWCGSSASAGKCVEPNWSKLECVCPTLNNANVEILQCEGTTPSTFWGCKDTGRPLGANTACSSTLANPPTTAPSSGTSKVVGLASLLILLVALF